jgi:hypothetical protein
MKRRAWFPEMMDGGGGWWMVVVDGGGATRTSMVEEGRGVLQSVPRTPRGLGNAWANLLTVPRLGRFQEIGGARRAVAGLHGRLEERRSEKRKEREG